jgi:hypothetical protein
VTSCATSNIRSAQETSMRKLTSIVLCCLAVVNGAELNSRAATKRSAGAGH